MDKYIKKTLKQKNISLVFGSSTILNNDYVRESSKPSRTKFINLNSRNHLTVIRTKKRFSVFSQLKHFVYKRGYEFLIKSNDIILFKGDNQIKLNGCVV